MKNHKKTFWGIMFLLIAVFIIASAMGVFGQIGFWTIAFTPFLIAWFVVGICKLSWGSILFSLAFLSILYDKMLGIEKLTPWPVLLAAMFGSIGLNIIFGKKNHFNIGKHHRPHFELEYSGDDKCYGNEVFTEMEHSFKSEVSFSEATKYINCQSLQKASIENSFGKTSIYFDGAALDNGKAEVDVDNAFGSVVLYIPKTWRGIVNIDKSFAKCEIHGKCAQESENVLYVNGENAFGVIDIYYI